MFYVQIPLLISSDIALNRLGQRFVGDIVLQQEDEEISRGHQQLNWIVKVIWNKAVVQTYSG